MDGEEKNKLEQMIDVVTDKIMEAASFFTGPEVTGSEVTGSEVIQEEQEVEEEEEESR